MPSSDKVEKVERLKERIDGSTALLLADYRGLTTADVMELRRSLVESGTRLAVVKNTLMRRAVEESGISDVSSLLEGPTAIGFVEGDAVAAAKRLVDAARRYPALELKGAWVEGRLLGPADAQTLATLDSREAMLSKIAGLAKAEMSRAAAMFQTLQGRFVGLLEAYRDKLPATEAAESAPDSTEAPSEAPARGAEESPASDASSDGVPADEASPGEPVEEASAEPASAPEPDAGAPTDGADAMPTADETEGESPNNEATEQASAQPEGKE